MAKEPEDTRQLSYDSWKASVPSWLGWLTAIAGIWSMISYIGLWFVGHKPFVEVTFFLSLLNVPAGGSMFLAVVLLFVSIALFRRKRMAAYLVLFYEILMVPLLIGIQVYIISTGQETWRWLAFDLVSVALSVIIIVLVWVSLPYFTGRIQTQNLGQTIGFLVAGLLTVFAIGLGLIFSIHPHGELSKHVAWTLRYMFSYQVLILFNHLSSISGYHLAGLVISLLTGLVAIVAVSLFFRGSRQQWRSLEDDLQLRRLLLLYPNDSLGYFATRANRSLVFSRDRKAAVSYAHCLGVAMAAGDPIGDPNRWDEAISRWKENCYKNGMIPAAMSVSQAGAAAYKRAGLSVKTMGDEAVVYTEDFDLHSANMQQLAKTARKVARKGVQISVQRASALTQAEIAEVIAAATEFREGPERGFSMGLERLLAPEDSQTLVVRARGESGDLECVLTFVPWGRDGVSLNLMRRSTQAVNGVIEAMIVTLLTTAKQHGISRVSLNFAMFHQIFEEGQTVDASLKNRLLMRLMLGASKIWQLQSLYESNARYNPVLKRRYFCFESSAWMTSSLIASGILEGFLPKPPWLNLEPTLAFASDEEYLERLEEADRELITSQLARRIPDQQQVRLRKVQALREHGLEPFPVGVDLGVSPAEALRREGAVTVSGRVRSRRRQGGVTFMDLERDGVTIQALFERDSTARYDLVNLIDRGDVLAVSGRRGLSRSGEESVLVDSWTIAAKSLRPIPGLGEHLDESTKARNRTLHLLTSPPAVRVLRQRSAAVAAIRATMQGQGFAEVETPMLHAVQGGANAQPFKTELNAYSAQVFLRIAPELYLKRLAVAGMDAIFELGRSFRNEGADATHNPEFTSLEAYRAGWDYEDMRRLTQQLIVQAAVAVHGRPVALAPARAGESGGAAGAAGAADFSGASGASRTEASQASGVTKPFVEVDLSGDWPVVPVYQAVSQAVGCPVSPDTSVEELRELCARFEIVPEAGADCGALVTLLYDKLVEENTWEPTFYTDFPVSTSPLTRKHRKDPRLAERWDLVAFGMELGTAYTELTDPQDQRQRFTDQSLAAAAGNPEAMSLDEDFLAALELGLVPTGGLGLGVDRVVMMLTGTNIRQTLCFPFVKPQQ